MSVWWENGSNKLISAKANFDMYTKLSLIFQQCNKSSPSLHLTYMHTNNRKKIKRGWQGVVTSLGLKRGSACPTPPLSWMTVAYSLWSVCLLLFSLSPEKSDISSRKNYPVLSLLLKLNWEDNILGPNQSIWNHSTFSITCSDTYTRSFFSHTWWHISWTMTMVTSSR